ncbi:hypothetical protein HMPREF1208_02050 [Staphylococcus sp. HGB0015]|uniref:Uncharacterized protein n=1 Tax=Staphylococcus schleiferi TaxID=1295 RepID=A0A7Z7VWK3_STASC|nr:hypothetical protein HMPREF1208_02050 [Staphylococcus sp. HGB0015]CAD7358976.1 Uncharacterised protein [Staphylococcus schleiferi]SUM87271.1 Uncharacterised protein [Staphylococcus schleiferi]
MHEGVPSTYAAMNYNARKDDDQVIESNVHYKHIL